MAFEGPSGLHDKLAQGFHPLGHLVHCNDNATVSSVPPRPGCKPQLSQECLELPGIFFLFFRPCKDFF